MIRRKFAWGFIFLWIITIFYFSSQPAEVSREKSMVVVEKIVEIIDTLQGNGQLAGFNKQQLNYYVRKSAHAFSYFVLTMGTLVALSANKRIKKHKHLFFYGWISSTLIAMTDEFYQTFIPGRSGELRDVLIDSIGIFLAIALFKLSKAIIKYNKNKCEIS